ncbi:MAG: RNB domain-containing ribonuclease [Prevotellaceae bacterium]|nr:RNB domain-containing ribonuclease [Candidatus Minthosoma caballi]
MGKKKSGLLKSSINKREMAEMLKKFLGSHPGRAFSLKSLFSEMGLSKQPLRMLCVDILNEMLDQQVIARNNDGEIIYNAHVHVTEGLFNRTSGGRNFVDADDGVGISIYDEDTLHALPGDRVKVALHAKKRGSNKLHGEVIEIVKRREKPFIGTVQIHHSVAFLVTSNGSLQNDIVIPVDKLQGAKNGEKVAVKVVDWPTTARNPIGEVVDVLGESGSNETEMHAILAEYGLPYKYPEHVEAAANKIDAGITPEEVAKREDFRDTFTVTIDPRDAKDFDDAISIKKVKDGVWEIGVHIADVSHYVLEGEVIDQEAEQRATSIYLVDRTIPMLPEHLCNGICSLRPDEEKLTFSAIFEMNEDAEVLNHRIKHTVIKSNRRYTYEEVQALFEKNGEATECMLIRQGQAVPTLPIPAAEVLADSELDSYRASLPAIDPASIPVEPVPADHREGQYADELITLNRIAKKLRKMRMENGAINFDREEPRFEIDEKGKPLSVYFKNAKDANKLVEEYMLLANRAVAESIGKVKKGEKVKVLPYRIHDLPDSNKLDNLGGLAARFGFHLITQGRKEDVAKSLNKLLLEVKGQKMQNLVEMASLRAMQKARYSTYNIGHYGLGFDYYTHFTSPIRRYPDLMVHRLLTRYEEGGASASQKKYEALCEHSSAMEQLAAAAERASIKYKQVEFMSDKIGQEFDAHISGVTEFGIYAEIDENHCEGLINVRFLGDEAFDFDDRNYCLVGRQTHHVFSLGDAIRIKVAQANLFRKQLDYEFVKKLSSDAIENNAFYKSFVDMEQKKAVKGAYGKKSSKSKMAKGGTKQKGKRKR